MKLVHTGALALAVALALVAGGCDNTEDATTVAPTTIKTVTDTFSGTLATSSSNIHSFKAEPGTVVVTLTAVGPTPGLAIGLILGVWDGYSCTAVMQNSAATIGASLTALATNSMELCARPFDAGTLTESATYTITAVRQASVTGT